ncbi:hypothetical protein HMPREF1370_01975 [Enterococcus faecium P1123]|nr:hypothetical protein HMPREF1374_02969 [Enterococcus faecium P1190]EJX79676.1 hypothetical protein HMPREF1370_01975 [Enterococcus faecium P1123]EJX93941.1 hypothetical protein HMPREF1365_01889 [Enterococcus faecium ERV168]EJY32644.1 hypothetical protein HMPREF1352_02653 [Enterococcus faecium 511]EJY41430.1 hypothetical protein HMPREF1350_01519 [Enterococcus faecium 509]
MTKNLIYTNLFFILFLLTRTFAKGYDFKCFQIKNKKEDSYTF